MEFNQANFDILVESRAHLNENILALNTQLEEGATALEAKAEEMSELAASHKVALSEAEGKLDSFKTETIARVQEGISYSATAEVIVNAINADDSKTATSLIMAQVESDGGTRQTPNEPVKGAWDGHSFNRGAK